MNTLNRTTVPYKRYKERIIQFGEGNFLRAFVDWIVWNMNSKIGFDSSIVVVQPIEKGMVETLNKQDGLYHLILKGVDDGKEIYNTQLVDVISRGVNPYTHYDNFLALAENPDFRFVVSNTTEAGIAFDPTDLIDDSPPASFPAKLVQLLYHRFNTFDGAPDKGLIIFPCELIFHNGRELKEVIGKYIELWELGNAFKHWFNTACGVYSTLVDRIVPGYPRENADEIKVKLGYDDKLLVEGEIFHLWVIEAPESVAREFPANTAGLNVLFVDSEDPYHQRKVTLLNAPHTIMSPVAYLAGLNTVGECINDSLINRFVHTIIFNDLIHTLDMPEAELKDFAYKVLDRFRNPYINHQLASIMLNSFAKYKTRVLPALKTCIRQEGRLPNLLVFGLAAIVCYYRGGKRGDDEIIIQDNDSVVKLIYDLWATNSYQKLAEGVLGAEFIWGEDLNEVEGLQLQLIEYIHAIQECGVRKYISETLLPSVEANEKNLKQ
ncbi:MAG: tagaturonate reductase [Prevotellaceae bacterium]|jgi:tagaturonate reductase|nr:tagaturonate reductase [Prevotellaceae bacterium]